MPLNHTTKQAAAAAAEVETPKDSPTSTTNAQSPLADTSPAPTTTASRRSSSSDGYIYPDSPTLGATRSSGTAGSTGTNDDTEEDNDKGPWGVPKVHESVGMATPVGQVYPLRRSSRFATAPRTQFKASRTPHDLPFSSSCPPVEKDLEELYITDECIMSSQEEEYHSPHQPRLEAVNLPETPPDTSFINDYQDYTFMRRAQSRGLFGMMETITEYSEESESIHCGKEKDGEDEVAVHPPPLAHSYSSITATTNVSRPSTRCGREQEPREPLDKSEPEPLALEDRLNMQAYVRAMVIYGGGAPERTSSIPQNIRSAPDDGSIGSLASMLTASDASLSTGISTNLTTQESAVSGRLRQELDLMSSARGAPAGPGSRPATAIGNTGLPGIDTSNPFAFLALRSSSLVSTSTITAFKPEPKPEAISEPTSDTQGEKRVPKDYLEGQWNVTPAFPDESILQFLREPSKAKEGRSINTPSPSSSNATKRSTSTVKLSSLKEDGGPEEIETKWGSEETLKPEQPPVLSSALQDNVRRWYLEEVMFTRIIAKASVSIRAMPDMSYMLVPETVRAQIRRLGEPLIQFGYEIQRYCLEYIEGYDLAWVILQWQQCQEGRDDTPEGNTKRCQRDSAIDMCDPRGSPDWSHAGSSQSRARVSTTRLPAQLQLPPVEETPRPEKLPNALAVQGCGDVPSNDTPSLEADARSNTPSSTASSEDTHASTTPSSPGPPLKPRPRPLTDEEEDQLVRAINAVVTELTHLRDDLDEIHDHLAKIKVPRLPTAENTEETKQSFHKLYIELVPRIPTQMDNLLALMDEKTKVIATILDSGPEGNPTIREIHTIPEMTMAGGLGLTSNPSSPITSPFVSSPSCPLPFPLPRGPTRTRTHLHHLLHTSQKTYPFRLAFAHAHLYTLRKLYHCPRLDPFTYRSLSSLESRLERLRKQDRVNDGAGHLCAMSHSVLRMAHGIQNRHRPQQLDPGKGGQRDSNRKDSRRSEGGGGLANMSGRFLDRIVGKGKG
ncbi:uncharacterized protein QC764_700730 [Podospora pseudoanserina]|uniref:Uncharacterized protein n=1 Tax=Podospora pseudoanserina TaxID=2609844 RepID=A0ABR0HM23_9PEZI|nr:hypothetical protein QC764_700730 [Podospora pseudoanserina]